ncbi:hypothetical protein FRC09_006340, partial [Ceratobasidium sp. 395]
MYITKGKFEVTDEEHDLLRAVTDHIQYAPVKHWTAEDRKCRVYGETNTGEFMWKLQSTYLTPAQLRIPDKYATPVLLLFATDRSTLLTMSGGQQVYPCYMTVANIDKSVRRKLNMRATTLVAYLPVDKFKHVADPAERSRLRRELTHQAMEKVVEELHTASEHGVEVQCADGRYRRAYPILAGNTLDFEEQCLMACTIESGCLKCMQGYHGRGKYGIRAPPRTNWESLRAIRLYLDDEDGTKVQELGLHPIWPWWANLPYADFAASLMPDILHQLHQGLLRHLVRWACVAARDWVRKKTGEYGRNDTGGGKVDQLFCLMPSAEGMRHFKQGITGLSQWTGRESKEVEKQLLPVIASIDTSNWDSDFVRLARALLDFIYRAQASRMTEDDLVRLEGALAEFHQLKRVLIELGVFKKDSRFDKIAKLHMGGHMVDDVCEMGTPDGFSTETPEHMHIESKRAWRASNKVCPTPQMIKFIQRYEGLCIHRARMNTYLGRTAAEGEKRRPSHVIYGDDEEPFHPVGEAPVGHEASGFAESADKPRKKPGEESDESDNDEEEDPEQ